MAFCHSEDLHLVLWGCSSRTVTGWISLCRPPNNTWTFSPGWPTLHHFWSLPPVWSLGRNARIGRQRVPQEVGHHLPLVLTCWLAFSCSQSHPGCCVEDVETAGPTQSFVHRVYSRWHGLTSEITATLWERWKNEWSKTEGKRKLTPMTSWEGKIQEVFRRKSCPKHPLCWHLSPLCDKFPIVSI